MEEIPLPDASVDVVISNGVINLSPRKTRVLAEIRRYYDPDRRLCVMTTVTGVLPRPIPVKEEETLRDDAVCVDVRPVLNGPTLDRRSMRTLTSRCKRSPTPYSRRDFPTLGLTVHRRVGGIVLGSEDNTVQATPSSSDSMSSFILARLSSTGAGPSARSCRQGPPGW
jgi:Methyltransferase domain